MNLFDDSVRNRKEGRQPRETIWGVLNRSAQPVAKPVRMELEKWFAGYPSVHRKGLRQRLKSRNDEQFYAAFFELYLHAVLRALGFDPKIPCGDARKKAMQDFVVHKAVQLLFRVEAKFLWKEKEHDIQDKYMREIERALNEVSSDRLLFALGFQGQFTGQPAYGQVKGVFEDWLRSNEKSLLALAPGDRDRLRDQPCFQIKEQGAILNIYIAAVRGPADKCRRAFCAWSPGVQHMQTDRRIRRELRGKATKYGKMQEPYIIAMATNDHVDELDMCNALLGEEVFGRNWTRRKLNGFWYGPRGPQNTRVSGVLIVPELSFERIAEIEPLFYPNPWADNPLPKDTLPFAYCELRDDGSMRETTRSRTIRGLLGLGKDWPRR